MFCTNCGKKIEDDSKFCEFCGAKVTEAPVQEAPSQRKISRGAGSIKKAEPAEKASEKSSAPQSEKKTGGGSKFWKTTLTAALIASGVFFLQGFLGDTPSAEKEVNNKQYNEMHDAQKKAEKINFKITAPKLEDFNWHEEVVANNFFKTGKKLEYHKCIGSWKAMGVYKQKGTTYSSRATYFANLTGRLADAQLILKGHKFYLEGAFPVSEDESKYMFTGGYAPDADCIVFRNEKFGVITMGPFVEKNGKQYGLGRFQTKDDVEADLLFVRP